MNNKPEQDYSDPVGPIDPVERLLVELNEASHAGVFDRTVIARCDQDSIASTTATSTLPPIVHILCRVNVWVPLSAAALLALGVWGWMFAAQISNVREQSRRMAGVDSGTAGHVAYSSNKVNFSNCLTGPNGLVEADCRRLDIDKDGDMDLADFGQVQLAYADLSQ